MKKESKGKENIMFSMKKILAIAGAGAMLVSVAACGSGTAGDDGGKKEISFQTWNLKNDKYTPYFEALIKAYEKDHPDVTVKWLDAPSDGYEDKLSSQAAAGETARFTGKIQMPTAWTFSLSSGAAAGVETTGKARWSCCKTVHRSLQISAIPVVRR